MREMIYQMGISMVIGINLTNTAEIIAEATYNSQYNQTTTGYRVPYMLIIAGTDANITFKVAQQGNIEEKNIMKKKN